MYLHSLIFQVNELIKISVKTSNDARSSVKNMSNNNNSFTSQTTQNLYSNSNNTFARKATKSSLGANQSAAYSTTSNNQQHRQRYQSNSNVSYSYSSTKRSRNSAGYTTTSNSSSYLNGGNQNYELAKKFLHAWYTYTMKILIWLFYLVYDTLVLGCSILFERLTNAYEWIETGLKQWYKDLRQNSNKPGLWITNKWRTFDARFAKNSKWAIWRKFHNKKTPEVNNESLKTGRLPVTGDEAMYQLLNCKGKDAYR